MLALARSLVPLLCAGRSQVAASLSSSRFAPLRCFCCPAFSSCCLPRPSPLASSFPRPSPLASDPR
eukprot:3934060-Rhodomonas_salina.3